MSYGKPLPVITDENEPFWAGLRERRLLVQSCAGCGHVRFPINRYCPRCLSDEATWQELSGRGTVFSYIVFHQVYNQAFAADVPYNVALIQLDEGPRMFSNVVGVDNAAVKVGDPVVVDFEDVTDDVTLPRFRPVPVAPEG
ncbi:hypothetical protein Aple_035920 [Acrocarpospora pleiomorpha]|uniref:DNA-binding protein n=1 Tax=Acrocarpospora pleiomorpha TaxID=90975 RepID=A0A5M3XJ46_9ACTN|nr:Zn-ribbon domain-containing OB-fold protein [Acrocarpospora pleiomorpha]GES20696.1 hypothetical protein Aple_035920 [Acrocarpospora pleiomorpha]